MGINLPSRGLPADKLPLAQREKSQENKDILSTQQERTSDIDLESTPYIKN